jgi:hypothetical protein
MTRRNKTIRTAAAITAAIMAASLLCYLFLPVPYTIYVQPDDGALSAADPVTVTTPLQQCLDGGFSNVTGIDLLLATYQRTNTNLNRFEIFTVDNGKKTTLFTQEFPSGKVKDNDYFSINFPVIPAIGKFCFSLTSSNATVDNSITYWMNSQSQPVLKLKSTVPLHQAMEQVVGASRFHLPIWLVIALCLLYLCANFGALFATGYEDQPAIQNVSKTASAHPRRARKKRV